MNQKKIVLNGGLINKNIKNDKINKIIKNKIELNKKQKINYKKNNIKISIKGKLGKQVKIKDNYYKNANSEIKISEPNILYKNENINSIEQNIKSNRSDYTKYINYDTNPNIKNKIFYNNEKITLIYK